MWIYCKMQFIPVMKAAFLASLLVFSVMIFQKSFYYTGLLYNQ